MSGALLLDAGVWLAARDRDDAFHAAAVHIVRGGAGDVAVLDLTLYEIANVATVRWRAPDEAEAARRHRLDRRRAADRPGRRAPGRRRGDARVRAPPHRLRRRLRGVRASTGLAARQHGSGGPRAAGARRRSACRSRVLGG